VSRGGSGANAITFTGGTNSLTITETSIINGNVVAQSGDTFGLGGTATTGTFDMSKLGTQYQNFGTFTVGGANTSPTWTLTGGPSKTPLARELQAGSAAQTRLETPVHGALTDS